jgi:hypothetical protein
MVNPVQWMLYQIGNIRHAQILSQRCYGYELSLNSRLSKPTSAIVAWPLPVYTFTRICSVEYVKRVESVFEIIAEPNRRAILSVLVSSQQSVGEIERQLRMPQPTVSKHLRVLREAGFVESTVDAQPPSLPAET